MWNSEVYTGKDVSKVDEIPGLVGKTAQVVGRLMKDLIGNGHHLYLDNFYTSEHLFTYLLQNNTGACGTVRKNRVKLPIEFKSQKLTKGSTDTMHNNNILAMRFNDKKDIMFLSTIHQNNKMVPTKERRGVVQMRQKLIGDYNQHMGYVDKNDQMLATHTCVRKCSKWTTKLAFHFIEEAIYDSYILYKDKHKGIKLKQFKLNLLKLLINDTIPDPPHQLPRKIGKHFPVPITSTKSKSRPSRKSIVCAKKKEGHDINIDINVEIVQISLLFAYTLVSRTIILWTYFSIYVS